MVLFISVIDLMSISNCNHTSECVEKSDPVSSDSDDDNDDELNEVNDLGKTLWKEKKLTWIF